MSPSTATLVILFSTVLVLKFSSCQAQDAPPVYLSLRETNYFVNQSEIVFTEIGQRLIKTPRGDALACNTNLQDCCGSRQLGEWYFPNGHAVRNRLNQVVFRNRGRGFVALNRKDNATGLTGLFCCKIPDADFQMQTFCANIVSSLSEPTTKEPVVAKTITPSKTVSSILTSQSDGPVSSIAVYTSTQDDVTTNTEDDVTVPSNNNDVTTPSNKDDATPPSVEGEGSTDTSNSQDIKIGVFTALGVLILFVVLVIVATCLALKRRKKSSSVRVSTIIMMPKTPNDEPNVYGTACSPTGDHKLFSETSDTELVYDYVDRETVFQKHLAKERFDDSQFSPYTQTDTTHTDEDEEEEEHIYY